MGFFQTFVDFLNRGGPAMYALLLLSIVSVGIVLERLYFFSRQHSDPAGLLREIGDRVSKDDMNGAIAVCDRHRGMLPKILQFGLYRHEKSRADISDALSISLLEQLNTLEANLSIIGTVAVIAPFVGLFGTVLGIIRAFNDIALKGNSTPAVVAAGVSEALVTTEIRQAGIDPHARSRRDQESLGRGQLQLCVPCDWSPQRRCAHDPLAL